MPTLSGALSSDVNGRYFVGPEGYQPKGTRVGATDFAAQHDILVGTDGTTPLFPNAAAVTDSTANPTLTKIASFLMGFTGSAWDRIKTLNGALQTAPVGSTNAALLPDAAAASDGMANPTTTTVKAVLLGFTGSAWDRIRGDATNGLDVDVTRLPTVSSSTDVSLGSAATSAQLLAANAARKGLILTNTDANDVYVYYGTTAIATKFTVKIPPGGYWEMPQPIYTGRIDAIWAADGSGSLIGSEL